MALERLRANACPRTLIRVDAGSHKENASKQKTGASVLIQSEAIMLQVDSIGD
jgi:hypothetical protein